MTLNIRLAQVSEAKELVNLYHMFLDEYELSNSKVKRLPFKQHLNAIRNDINDKRVYVVTFNNKIVAFTDLIEMGNDKVSYFFIRNLFVSTDYRNRGIAQMLRDTLIQRKRITGTTVTYKRLREHMDYFNKSFKYVYHDVTHEQNANDNNLIYLSTEDIWGSAFNIDFHSVNLLQQAAQNVLNRHTQMLRNAGYEVVIK